MSVVIINSLNGKYYNQVRGSRRGDTELLSEAQIFPSVGKAKVAYNHRHATTRSINKHNRSLLERFPERTNIKLYDIPAFQTMEVEVIVTGQVVSHD